MADEVIFKDQEGNEIPIATVSATPEEIKESLAPKQVIIPQLLPDTGTVFSINGAMYKVTYVNIGKTRFSASPVI
jgi:hypothetical protein